MRVGWLKGDVEGPGGVSPLGRHRDNGDDGETCGGQVVGIPPVGGSTRIRGITPHTVVHSEIAGNYRIIGCMPTYL